MDIDLAKKILKEDPNIKIVLVNKGQVIYRSEERGILPMYKLTQEYKDEAIGGAVADRVIGRGAGILASYLRLDSLYGELMSENAIEFLSKKNISYSYLTRVPYIKNREKNDYCPVEKLSLNVNEEKELLKRLKEFLGI